MSRMKLKDIAVEKKERVENPSQSPYSIFVGLEHYDSGEATIRRYGSTERLESTMKAFHAGDILVARRNVYLKRAATVDFDGLTSGDSIVLHIENEDFRRIIPFVLNTDDFWNYANQHADGSMSKRLSPKLLMEYEFSLPDDNLEQVSNILWAMERTKTAYRDLIAKTDELVKSQFIEMFDEINGAEYCPLEKCCKSITGGNTPSMQHPEYYGGSIPFIKSGDVKEHRVSQGSLCLTELALRKTTAKIIPAGSVLVVIRSAALRHQFHTAIAQVPLVINQDLKALQAKTEFLPEYLMWALIAHEERLLGGVQTVLTSHIEMRTVR